MKISITEVARHDLDQFSSDIRKYVIDSVKHLAPLADIQMPVVGMCWELPDHIYRAMKLNRFKPGIRAIFYIESVCGDIVFISIKWRCDDPYGDGN